MPIRLLLLALLATCLASTAGRAQHGTPFELRGMTPEVEDAAPGQEPGPESKSVPEIYRRQPVFYRTGEAPGTIIIDTSERFLYL
ncbi:MAG: L,D-transpeptidase, partial [Xanthobacteraceae bacterium]